MRWFCPDELLEGIEGDLEEAYHHDLHDHGRRTAKWLYGYKVLRFFRLEIISRKKINILMINRALLSSHIKITFRNFRKQLGYSFINLTGLALGIAVCLLIFSYTHEQLHFDDFHPDINRLYWVNQTAIWNPEGGMMSSTPPPLAAALKEKIPAVESVLRINTPGGYEVRLDHEQRGLLAYREDNVLAADSTFFDFFAIELAKGDRATALAGKNKVVINDLVANKYFGTENPLGKTIFMNQIPMLISGVTSFVIPDLRNSTRYSPFLILLLRG